MNTTETTRIELINPQIAQEYLTHNISNRPVRDSIVKMYANQMKEGLWVLSNDSIAFSASGHLLNGQHRLKAVISSGATCEFNVIRGLSEDSFVAMDNGYNRTSGNVFYLNEIPSSTTVAAIVKRKMLYENRRLTAINVSGGPGGGSNNKLGNAQLLDEYNKHSEAYQNISRDSQKLYGKSRLMTQADYGGFLAYLSLCAKHPYDVVFDFFKEFTEISKVTNDVIVQLRQRFVNDKIGTTRMTATARQKLLIKAWNAYVTGKTVKRLNYIETTDKDLWFI